MDKVAGVLRSRKFWAGSLVLAIGTLMYWQGVIGPESYVQTVLVVAGLYMGTVALEDGLTQLFLLWAARDRDMMRRLEEEARELRSELEGWEGKDGDALFR